LIFYVSIEGKFIWFNSHFLLDLRNFVSFYWSKALELIICGFLKVISGDCTVIIFNLEIIGWRWNSHLFDWCLGNVSFELKIRILIFIRRCIIILISRLSFNLFHEWDAFRLQELNLLLVIDDLLSKRINFFIVIVTPACDLILFV